MFKNFGVNFGRLETAKWCLVASAALMGVWSCGREAKDTEETEQATRFDAKANERKAGDTTTPVTLQPTAPVTISPTIPQNSPRIFAADDGVLSAQGMFRARIKAWTAGPQVTQNDTTRNEFTVEFASSTGLQLPAFEIIQLSPYMKIHGHGVPRAYLPTWQAEGNNVNITRLGFIMSGPWEIKIQVSINGVDDGVEIPIEVP